MTLRRLCHPTVIMDGADISHLIKDVEIYVDYGEELDTITGTQYMNQHRIEVTTWTGELTPAIQDSVDPAPTTHLFHQDRAEQAQLCEECGMWPDHHNHSRPSGSHGVLFGRKPCVCVDCMPTADYLPDEWVPASSDDW